MIHRLAKVLQAHIGTRQLLLGISRMRLVLESLLSCGLSRRAKWKPHHAVDMLFPKCDPGRVFTLTDVHRSVATMFPESTAARHWDAITQCLSIQVFDSDEEDEPEAKRQLQMVHDVDVDRGSHIVSVHSSCTTCDALESETRSLQSDLCINEIQAQKTSATGQQAEQGYQIQNQASSCSASISSGFLQCQTGPAALWKQGHGQSWSAEKLEYGLLAALCMHRFQSQLFTGNGLQA